MRFLKHNISSDSILVMQYPLAYVLLTHIAMNASRYDSLEHGLKAGECRIGDYESLNMTRGQYRQAIKKLVELGHIKIVETSRTGPSKTINLQPSKLFFTTIKKTMVATTSQPTRGTKVKLISTTVYDLNLNAKKQVATKRNNHHNNHQQIFSQPRTKNCLYQEEIKQEQTANTYSPEPLDQEKVAAVAVCNFSYEDQKSLFNRMTLEQLKIGVAWATNPGMKIRNSMYGTVHWYGTNKLHGPPNTIAGASQRSFEEIKKTVCGCFHDYDLVNNWRIDIGTNSLRISQRNTSKIINFDTTFSEKKLNELLACVNYQYVNGRMIKREEVQNMQTQAPGGAILSSANSMQGLSKAQSPEMAKSAPGASEGIHQQIPKQDKPPNRTG